jgi:hypothetical protein
MRGGPIIEHEGIKHWMFFLLSPVGALIIGSLDDRLHPDQTLHGFSNPLTMKFSASIAIAGVITPGLAIPQYLSTRQFVPQEWIAPGPSDCEFPEHTSSLYIDVSHTNCFTKLVVLVPA